MPIRIKQAAAWTLIKDVYVKQAGAWKNVSKTFVKRAGAWYLVHSGSAINVVISANSGPLNIFTLAGSPPGPVVVNFTINFGIWVSANSVSVFALTVGAFAAGSVINIVNGGYIAGFGGYGGPGVGVTSGLGQNGGGPGENGAPGLDARRFGAAFTINIANNGWIGGGGGGGGGGAGAGYWDGQSGWSGGGGGGGGGYTGLPYQSAGGAPGYAGWGGAANGQPGGVGTPSGGGGGGAPGAGGGVTVGGVGGTGGYVGTAGGTGGNCQSGFTHQWGPYVGGAAGYSVYGYSEVVWAPLGTLYGPTTG